MLVGESVNLRPVTHDDLDRFQTWDDDAEVTRYLGRTFKRDGGPAAWLRRTCKDPRRKALAITFGDGTLIGYMTLEDISWRSRTGEMRICLGDRRYWNRGLGTEAVKEFLTVIRTWGIRRVLVRVYREHAAAVRCYHKAGFDRVAVLRGGRVTAGREMYLMRWEEPARERGVRRDVGA